MADAKRVAAPSGTGLEAISGVLNLFGQNQKQTATANTGPLEALLAQLSAPTDPAQQLAGLFQQAGSQIPKFQQAFGNSVGARTGGNAPMNAALQNLLQQTTLAGQKQIADQDLQRQQIAANAAGNLAQATRSVNQTTSPNTGTAAKVLGGMQVLGKLGITDKVRNGLLGSGVDAVSDGSALFSGTPYASYIPEFGNNVFSTASESSLGEGLASMDWGNILSDAGSSFLTDSATDIASSAAGDVASEAGGNFLSDAWEGVSNFFGWADGGLIGRDDPDDDKSRKEMIARLNAKREKQKSGGIGEDSRYSSGDKELVSENTHYNRGGILKVEKALRDAGVGYADGGSVRSGGGRASSRPTFTPVTRATTAAINSSGQRPSSTAAGNTGSKVSGGGGGNGLSDRDNIGFGDGNSFDFGSIPVGGAVGPTAGVGTLGSGNIGTGVPSWAIGLLGSALGLNPLLSFALKQGNDYLYRNDPLNPRADGTKDPLKPALPDNSENAGKVNDAFEGIGGVPGLGGDGNYGDLGGGLGGFGNEFGGGYGNTGDFGGDGGFGSGIDLGTPGDFGDFGGGGLGGGISGGDFGGGSGGGCVHVDSTLSCGRRAGDIRVGDTLELADEVTLEASSGVVNYSEKKVMPGWKLTAGGISLVCSDSAPIPTRRGLKTPPELLHEYVAVLLENGEMGWFQVTATPIGPIEVQHISVSDKCFWAGESYKGFILHHNKFVFEFAEGGKIQGPGTKTSDSIPAMLSKGEYIIPADVVDAVGAQFFDHLKAQFHTMTKEGK